MADRENNIINLTLDESRHWDVGKGIVRIDHSAIAELPIKVKAGYITELRTTEDVRRYQIEIVN